MALDNPSYFSMSNPPPISSLSSSVSSTASSCSSPHSQSKRSLRSLLRSLSTNSADSAVNPDLFNTGAPRLSDIAPEFKFSSEPRRSNSLKTKSSSTGSGSNIGLTNVQRLYAPLPTSEADADCNNGNADDDDEEEHEDEVFVAHEEDANVRYYNVKSVAAPPPRRHSISTLRGARVNHTESQQQSQASQQQQQQSQQKRQRQRSIDLQEAVVHSSIEGQSCSTLANRINLQIDDHKLRHGSYPRKRCNRCPKGIVKRTDMEDILIVSAKDSEPANLWAQYFVSYFEQISQNANRKPYKIRHLGIEEILSCNGDVRHIAERTASVKLQLIILCPLLLEKIQDNSPVATSISKLLHPDRILALQLGTSDADITDHHKEAFPSYLQWQRRPVGQDQDQNFALEFVASAIAIFTKIWKQQSCIASEENSQFSIAPKKIRYGQTSVLIMLEYPLQHEDIVKISVVKNEEMTEIKNVKRRNPYTLKFTIPEKFLEVSAIVNILVEKNGSIIGKRPIKCESRLRELEQILRSTNNPVEFMCQSLGFSPHDPEQLDNWLVHMFQKNVPPNFSLFVNNDTVAGGKHVCELFPTLLHFSSRFGLEKLTAQLLDCPGGDIACDIRNVQDFTPADIAENVGHKEINNMLRGYMKMNELATVYTKIKKLTTANLPQFDVTKDMNKDKPSKTEELNTDKPQEEHYLVPKKLELLQMDDFYKMCPAPKPVNMNQKQSKSAPTTPSTEDAETPMAFYIPMDLKKTDLNDIKEGEDEHNYQNFTVNETRATATSLPENLISSPEPKPETQDKDTDKQDKNRKKRNKHKHHSSLQSITSKNSKSSLNIKEDKVQVELAEIINDFKNNVHTIAQTEQLVAEWQNRNDVQKSFKEKQDQLKEMRLRYEQIQRDMKHGGRRTSPFERFKKIFGWSHNSYQVREHCGPKCSKEEVKGTIIQNGTGNANDARPISSLSLQSTSSSASSGTMSTISGCSLGDSGTHSDHEERKHILSPLDDELKSTAMNNFNNYLIPPTPRPVKPLMSQSCSTIEARIRKDSGERLDPFYIQFPPNGLPVSTGLKFPSEDPDEVDGASSHLFTIPEHMNMTQTTRLSEDAEKPKTESFASQQEYMNLPNCSNCPPQHDYMNFKAPS